MAGPYDRWRIRQWLVGRRTGKQLGEAPAWYGELRWLLRIAEELRCSVFDLEPGLRRNTRALVAWTQVAVAAEGEADREMQLRTRPRRTPD